MKKVKIHTSLGTMVVKLYDETPVHRDNFLKLATESYYDGTTFHRVIKSFMIQGGDPNTKNIATADMAGTGGPGYTLEAEIKPGFFHKKGALAAARQGDAINPQKRSSGSQFYIVQGSVYNNNQLESFENRMKAMKPGFAFSEEQKTAYTTLGGTPHLDMDYTVFGEISEGLDVLDAIAKIPTLPGDRPAEEIKMTVSVVEDSGE
jgi:cyclophilin family peptidyl-prolyl cis-trans isomerase